MNVELTEEQKIKILNSSDVYMVIKQILMRENKIERDQEHAWCVCLAVQTKKAKKDEYNIGKKMKIPIQ